MNDDDIVDPDDIEANIPGPTEIDWGPIQKALDEGEPCPECDYPYDSDEWDCRHLHGGPALGESWLYTCPNCEQETCTIGT